MRCLTPKRHNVALIFCQESRQHWQHPRRSTNVVCCTPGSPRSLREECRPLRQTTLPSSRPKMRMSHLGHPAGDWGTVDVSECSSEKEPWSAMIAAWLKAKTPLREQTSWVAASLWHRSCYLRQLKVWQKSQAPKRLTSWQAATAWLHLSVELGVMIHHSHL